MSGFDNETVYATNIDLRGVTPIVGQFQNDGELLIGDATGGIGSTPTGLRGVLKKGNGINIEYASGTPGNPSSLTISSTATGAWTFITAVTASTSASVEFTGLSPNFCMFMVVLKNIAPDTDDTYLVLRTSSNNGSSFDSGGSDYDWANFYARLRTGGFSLSGSDGDTGIRINGDNQPDSSLGNESNQEMSGMIYIYAPSDTLFTRVSSTCTLQGGDNNDTGATFFSGGTRREAALVDAIQFSISAGNIASGKFALYGLTS